MTMGKHYRGKRLPINGRIDTSCDTVVTVIDGANTKPLPWRLDLFNHSRTGLNWGYGGSGPAQLALALLADVLGSDEMAVRLHQHFKNQVVARLADSWTLDAAEILSHVDLLLIALEQKRTTAEQSRNS